MRLYLLQASATLLRCSKSTASTTTTALTADAQHPWAPAVGHLYLYHFCHNLHGGDATTPARPPTTEQNSPKGPTTTTLTITTPISSDVDSVLTYPLAIAHSPDA
nr:unnamed protein product [Spirometra erinaceieuropaei]